MARDTSLDIPEYVEKIRSLDLDLAGKCMLAIFSPDVIEYVDSYLENNHSNIKRPFDYFFKTCKQQALRIGAPTDASLLSERYKHFRLHSTSPYVKSDVIRKKVKKGTTYSGNIKEAIKKQIERKKDISHVDRSGMDEFIYHMQVKNIEWQHPGAQMFANILMGKPAPETEEVKKPRILPLFEETQTRPLEVLPSETKTNSVDPDCRRVVDSTIDVAMSFWQQYGVTSDTDKIVDLFLQENSYGTCIPI